MDYQSSSNNFVLHGLRRETAVVFKRGENARLWDTNGKMYLDTMSGSAGPAMVGHAHPAVVRAVSEQIATLPSVNLLHDSTSVIEFCAALAEIAPAGLSKTFMCPGGGEAVEAAIKFAIRITGRNEVLSLSGGYHGMSLGMMSLTGMPPLRNWMPGGVRWPTFRQVPSGDMYRPTVGSGSEAWKSAIQALENSLDFAGSSQPAALLIEIVQGPNGHAIFPAEWYQQVQRVCRERGVLLIVDEIQTGLGRCGAMWASELFGVQPDILVLGKGLGGGVPIGAFITRPELIPKGLESEPWHILTFMNQPLAAAAGLAVLETIKSEGLVDQARTLGNQASAYFRELSNRYEVVGDVRGPGLFIGVDFVENRESKKPATAACHEAWAFALERGLITQFGGMGGNVYKFKPPLTTPAVDFERMLEISEEMVAFIQKRVDAQE